MLDEFVILETFCGHRKILKRGDKYNFKKIGTINIKPELEYNFWYDINYKKSENQNLEIMACDVDFDNVCQENLQNIIDNNEKCDINLKTPEKSDIVSMVDENCLYSTIPLNNIDVKHKMTFAKYSDKKKRSKSKNFRLLKITPEKLLEVYAIKNIKAIDHIGPSALAYINLFASTDEKVLVFDNIKGLGLYTIAYHSTSKIYVVAKSTDFRLDIEKYITDERSKKISYLCLQSESEYYENKKSKEKISRDPVAALETDNSNIQNDLFSKGKNKKDIVCVDKIDIENELNTIYNTDQNINETQNPESISEKKTDSNKSKINEENMKIKHTKHCPQDDISFPKKIKTSTRKIQKMFLDNTDLRNKTFDRVFILGLTNYKQIIQTNLNLIGNILLMYIYQNADAVEMYNYLLNDLNFVDVTICDFMFREWQVLLNVRPKMNCDMRSGYIVKATRIFRE
ncbi:hypothetical protein EDEG_00626 [Edhazardia aedis USNM 41457]|uniref:tRNA (adenine(58)-N(1))-methyltransferase non-catalytic subunit TRM6 n=1 Tax=Edhazardia aedis (strain USNM 41457) TaxID=1003232 RepID=J9A088_EDHAE|nr:hypothetical protein EDEG_00626 [Edhazardia aedis USNM 41457]|eukprot:EJW05323.1 hypothetical protein EDEG_00626 [Edhazardia aedis USNM 41457]